jgi:predicted N-formylglutamate amidohydrolase
MHRCATPITLVTLHSFTPVFKGVRRSVEIGFLHHDAGALARAATEIEANRGAYNAQVNAPYSASDGVTYSLQKHGDARGLASVMVEVRNDLIDTVAKAEKVADHLSETLLAAIAKTQQEAIA